MTWFPAELPPQPVLAYVSSLAGGLRSALNGEVLAAYLHGSAVLGGWQAAISDVDILIIVRGRLAPELATALSAAVLTTVPACPGTGLELSAVAQADAYDPRPPWQFITHVTSAKNRPPQEILGEDHPGDPDLLLHYAVCRQAGWPFLGPPATELIGTIARAHVLEALSSELMWGLEHAPAHYGLLNACVLCCISGRIG